MFNILWHPAEKLCQIGRTRTDGGWSAVVTLNTSSQEENWNLYPT